MRSANQMEGLTVLPEDEITYTIEATNNGTIAAVGATVTDNLPAALTGVSWTCSGTGGGTCLPVEVVTSIV